MVGERDVGGVAGGRAIASNGIGIASVVGVREIVRIWPEGNHSTPSPTMQ